MNLKQMKRELDALIRTVKTAEPMADVRFIKEYSGANAEMPVRGWIGVVRLCELSAAPRYIGEALCPAGGPAEGARRGARGTDPADPL